MRLPISRPTPLECVLWAGAGLAWAVAAGVPAASLLQLGRHQPDLVRIDASRLCRANDPIAGRAIFRPSRE